MRRDVMVTASVAACLEIRVDMTKRATGLEHDVLVDHSEGYDTVSWICRLQLLI